MDRLKPFGWLFRAKCLPFAEMYCPFKFWIEGRNKLFLCSYGLVVKLLTPRYESGAMKGRGGGRGIECKDYLPGVPVGEYVQRHVLGETVQRKD